MIFPDYHLHSSFSEDSDANIYEIIKAAKQKGMKSICITDHYDMDFPVIMQDPSLKFDLDMSSYYETMNKVKNDVQDSFDLKIGIELGFMPSTTEKLNKFVRNNPQLDFVIASLHIVDGLDPYYPEYFLNKTDSEGYYHYFDTILQCLKSFTEYNVCGHLDYIIRYGKSKHNNYTGNDYKEIFKELFNIIIPKGKGIEINTGSLYKGIPFPHPHIDILKLYKEAGGEIITIGSDAHKPEFIGYGFDIAKEVLLENGFKYFCTYEHQKPTFHKIG